MTPVWNYHSSFINLVVSHLGLKGTVNFFHKRRVFNQTFVINYTTQLIGVKRIINERDVTKP